MPVYPVRDRASGPAAQSCLDSGPVWKFVRSSPPGPSGAHGPCPGVHCPPGPNNPVGIVWIDLSKDHYGIHGTPEPSKIGYTQSHGCIRLTNWDAWKLAAMVKPGTPAILQE